MKTSLNRYVVLAFVALMSLAQAARAQVFSNSPLPSVQYVGTTAHFGVSTNTGNPSSGIFWQVYSNGNWVNLTNGVQIGGAQGTNLVISNLAAANAGSYQVVFTNATTTNNTTPVTLTILPLPATNTFAYAALSYNPIAFWPLNESTTNPANGGVLAYDVAGGFTGTYLTGSLNGNTGIAGPEAPAYVGFPSNNFAYGNATAGSTTAGVVTWSTPTIEGVNSTPPVTGAAAANGSNFTFLAWIFPTKNPETQYATWFWIRSGVFGASRTDGFRSQGTSGVADAVTYTWNNNSSTTYAFAGPVFPTNSWSMVAAVITPSNCTLYSFNTNSVGSTVQTLAEDNEPWGVPACIGNDTADGRPWIGSMADVLLYNSSLSQIQLFNLFTAGVGAANLPSTTEIIGVPLPTVQYPGTTAHFGAQTNTLSLYPGGVYWQVNTNGTWMNLTNGLQASGSTISGAQTINLTVSNLSAANVGSYRMYYTNAITTTNTPPVTLGLLALPATNSFAGVALSYNPVAFWPLNESATNPTNGDAYAYDVAGGFTGTYLTNSQDGFDGVAGPEAPAFAGFPSNNYAYGAASSTAYTGVVTWSTPTFEGPNATPPVTNAAANSGTNVTFVAWIYPTEPEPQYASWLWMRAGVFGATRTDGFRSQGTSGVADAVTYTWDNNSATTYAFAGPVFPTNTWSMVAVVVTPTNATLYCFNSEGASNEVQTLAQDNEPWGASACIGNDTTQSGRAWIGSIADVLLYNSSLSQLQLFNLFAAGLAKGDVLPSITIPPVSATLYDGRTAQFSVGASGFGQPLSYQWQIYSNGTWVNVSGATGSVLSISNVSAASDASYQVIVSDVLGSVTSAPPVSVTAVAPTMALPAYPQAVSNLNPVAYWRLGETGPLAYDLWGGFTGTYGNVAQGLAGSGPDSPAFPGFEITNTGVGVTNELSDTDATNSYVAVPPLNLNTNTVTFTAWVYPFTPAEIGFSSVFMNRGSGSVGGMIFSGGQNNDLTYNWNNQTTTYNWDSGVNVPYDEWSFVAVVISPQNGAVYVYNDNAQAAAVNAVPNAVQSFAGNSLIGSDSGYPSGVRQFDGFIDEVAIFNQALTEDQINTLFAAASGMTASVEPVITSPLASPFFENVGATATFTITALASSGATYVWQLNGATLTNGNNGFPGTLFSGSTGPTLTISNYTAAIAGDSLEVEVFNPNNSTPATSSLTLPNTIPTTAIWTTDFCITNSGVADDDDGYQGLGVLSNGTNWNCIDDEGPTDPAFNGGPWTSTTSFNDTRAFNTGVAVTIPLAGIETFTPPYASLLLDVDAIMPTSYTPTGVIVTAPPGFYNIVLYAIDGPNSHRGTIFTINGNSQLCENSTATGDHDLDTSFIEGVNFVIYTNVEISSGTLDIGTAPDPNADGGGNTEAIFNGLQLQLVQPITLAIKQSRPNVVLTYSGGTLLQGPTVLGPWTTNSAPSPVSIPATNKAQYFELQLGDGLPSD